MGSSRRTSQKHRTQRHSSSVGSSLGSSYARRLRFEALEDRRMLSCTPGPDGDTNDQICEPVAAISNGETLSGAIGNGFGSLDVDLYAVTISSSLVGKEITFTVNTTDTDPNPLDTYLRLFDDAGVELEDDEDGGPGNNSLIDFTFSSAGTYYLGVSSSSNEEYSAVTGEGDSTGAFSSTGGYEVTFEDTDDQIDEAIPFLSGLVLHLDLPTDVDVFRFDAVEGTSFQFDAVALASPSLVDSYIRIFDDGGNQVDFDDDGGDGSNARLTVTFPDTDDFYVAVSSFANRNYDVETGTGDSATATDTGLYLLTATEVSLDPDDRIENAIDLGNLFTEGTRLGSDSARFDGEIDTSVDVDLYKFVVGRDGSFVEIDVDTSLTLFSLEPYLRLFNASGGQITISGGDNAPGEVKIDPDPFIGMTLAAGTYYAGVSAFSNVNYNVNTGLNDSGSSNIFATGSYTIDIQDRLHVDTTSDTNTGTVADNDDINTLREAIAFANDTSGSQTITFQPSVFASGETITLSVPGTNQLEITDSVVIEGLGADKVAISGNDNSRVFLIDNGNDSTEIDVTIAGVTIRDGQSSTAFNAGTGGGIRNSENLTLENVTVASNTSFFNSTHVESGGGIFHRRGVLVVTSSTFSGNFGAAGGGIRLTSGSAEITNSTFSGNSARSIGGGVSFSGSSTVTVRSTTFTGNRADYTGSTTENHGGGLYFDGGSTLILHNSIVAGNFTGTGNQESDIQRTVSATVSSSSSHNLIGGSAPGISNDVNGNIVGNGSGGVIPIGTILNTTLANNGGPTLTHALVVGSPAINKGNNAEVPFGITTDQRGAGFTRIIGGTVDIGAFESQTVPSPSPGDFNGDSTVDAADYTVWRDNLGASNETTLNGNGDGLNGVDQADYNLWVSNFGTTFPATAVAFSTISAPVLDEAEEVSEEAAAATTDEGFAQFFSLHSTAPSTAKAVPQRLSITTEVVTPLFANDDLLLLPLNFVETGLVEDLGDFRFGDTEEEDAGEALENLEIALSEF